MTARWIRQGAEPLALALLLDTGATGDAGRLFAPWARHMAPVPVVRLPAPAALPPGYTLYASKILPYRIGHPAGWQAQGSIFGNVRRPTGIYYDADIFSKKRVAWIKIQGEGLPPGSPLTSMCYREMELLDLQRAKEGDLPLAYTATRGKRSPSTGRGPISLMSRVVPDEEVRRVTSRLCGWRIGGRGKPGPSSARRGPSATRSCRCSPRCSKPSISVELDMPMGPDVAFGEHVLHARAGPAAQRRADEA